MTEEQLAKAMRLRGDGMGYYAIAAALKVSRSTIRYWFEKPDRVLKRGPRMQRRSEIEGQNRPEITPEALEDRDRRYATAPRDLTALLQGDPLPGYSALDRFQSVGDVALRLVGRLERQRAHEPQET